MDKRIMSIMPMTTHAREELFVSIHVGTEYLGSILGSNPMNKKYNMLILKSFMNFPSSKFSADKISWRRKSS